MDDFANQPLDYTNPTPLKLTPVDGDPFAEPSLEPGERSITVTPRDSDASKVKLTPVDHDPFALPAAPTPQYDQNGNPLGDVAPSFQETATNPNNPYAMRVAAAIPYALQQEAAGIVGMPQQAIELGQRVGQETNSSPASTDQPVQPAGPSDDSVAQSTNLAAGLIAPGMQFAEPGALGAMGGAMAHTSNPLGAPSFGMAQDAAASMTPHEARQAALTAELSNYFQTPTRGPVVDKASLPQHVQDLADQYKVSPNTAQVFQDHLDKAGMPHDEFLNTMFGQGNNHELTTSYNGELNMQSGIRDGQGNYVGLIQRSIDPKTNTASHDFFEVHPDQQGSGIAKQMLARQIPLYQKMGLDAVTTHANIDVGGYAWARYGFVPEQSSWRPLARQINEERYKLEESGALSAEDGHRVGNMMKGPESIRDIADLRQPVTNETGATMPLGKALLLGSSWHGKLNLKDPATMERFNAYVK